MGSVTATQMAEQGAEAVILTDIDEDRCAAAAHRVETAGARALVRACDLRVASEVESLMSIVRKEFGRLDVLHNNAGVLDTQFTDQTRVDNIPEEVWDRVFDVNVKAVWLCTKYAAALLRASGRGAIVNAASVSGLVAFPTEPAYCASKAAVIQLTRNTALDLAPDGTRCNCYCPQSTDTPMLNPYWKSGEDRTSLEFELVRSHLVPRLGHSEDIARLVCFLASDDAAFINGASITIDGGSLAWRGLRDV